MKKIILKHFILPVLSACLFITLNAQSIGLLKDINTSKDGNPTVSNQFIQGNKFAVIGKVAYFLADDGIHGQELWRCDTSNSASAHMVKDITPGKGSTNIHDLVVAGGKLYFTGPGDELWVSNGTSAGTLLLCHITSYTFLPVGNKLYFTKAIGGYDPNQIWKTDGTLVGTVEVVDLNTAATNYTSGIGQLTYLNGTIFFTTYSNSAYGAELWKTNGTQAGTVLVKDINPGTASSYPQNLTPVNGKLYFSAVDSTGSHLWVTDGTTPGTKKVKNTVNSSVQNSADFFNVIYVNSFRTPDWAAANNILYFPGYVASKGWELCSYNTADTTGSIVVAADINPGAGSSSPSNLTAVNNTVYFTASDSTAHQRLYKNSGTLTGHQLVKDIDPTGGAFVYFSNLTNANGALYFSGYNRLTGYELWKSNGTTAGTVMVKDVFPGAYNSAFVDHVTYVTGNIVLFSADDGVHGQELWKTDGTAAGTVLLKDINTTSTSSSTPSFTTSTPLIADRVTLNGKTYFAATDAIYGNELFVSDGTVTGTKMVKNIANGNESSSPHEFVVFKNAFYFLATENDTVRLFKSDGTLAGTTFIHTFPTGHGEVLTATDSSLYIFDGIVNYMTIWKCNGTQAGMVFVKTISGNLFFRSDLAKVGNTLYFGFDDGIHGAELWKTNGTAVGTGLVKDIYPGKQTSFLAFFYTYKGKLYFDADDSTGTHYYVSDGTAAGTKLLSKLHTFWDSPYPLITTLNGKIIFAAYTDSVGNELYTSDGTTAGTVLLKDIYPGTQSSNPDDLTAADSIAYFTATNPKNGVVAVWRTNGTTAGTYLVNQDPNSTTHFATAPQDLIFLNHKLYFADFDSTGTWRLWVSNGTLAGTHIISGFTVDYFDAGITSVGNNLLFSAYTYAYGDELYGGLAPGMAKKGSLALQGRLINNNGLLNWYTTGDAGSAYIVQRSINGGNFNNIGLVNGSGSDGFAQSNFDFTDGNITSLGVPVIYYRLQEITTDGDTAASKIVILNIDDKFKASVFPNPVIGNATLQVSGAGKSAFINITDMAGKSLWYGIAEGDKTMPLPVNNLPAGIYVVTVSNGEQTKTIKLVKER